MIILVTDYTNKRSYVEYKYNGKVINYILCSSKEEALDIIIDGIKRFYSFAMRSPNDEDDEDFFRKHIIIEGYYWNSIDYQDTFDEDHIFEFRWVSQK